MSDVNNSVIIIEQMERVLWNVSNVIACVLDEMWEVTKVQRKAITHKPFHAVG